MRPVAAVGVVAFRGDSVLLVRRGREPRRGAWTFPGGAVEAGEAARAAARREAREETGIDMTIGPVVDVWDGIFTAETGEGYHYCVADFLAAPAGPAGEPRPGDDAAEARWIPLDSLSEFEITPEMLRVIDRALWLNARRGPPSLGEESSPGRSESSRWAGCIHGSLYALTADRGPGRGHLEVARAALQGGARVVQLRDKERGAAELVAMGREIRRLTIDRGALFIVNDRADVAIAAGADGVHLGQADLSPGDARALLGPDACIGVSVESVEQARRAQRSGADYVGVGDIYGTGSKPDAGDPVGLDHLRRVRGATSLPIVAIGGITAARVPEVLDAGADSVAVIAAMADAEDMVRAAEEIARLAASSWQRR